MAHNSRTLAGALVFTLAACNVFFACSSTVPPADPTDVSGPSNAGLCGDAWSPTASMAQGRHIATATRLVDGSVLVAGGAWLDGLGNGGFTPGAERFNPSTNTWSAAGTLNVPRYGHQAVRLQDGRVLVVGGFSDSGPLTTVEIYNPTTNAWTLARPMATDRYVPQAVLLSNGRVLVSGGIGGGLPALASAEVYDPVANTWTSTGAMTSPRFFAGTALLNDGRVLIAGGNSSADYLSSAEIYNPTTGTWTAVASMSMTHYAFGMKVLQDGRVVAAGGTDLYPGAEIFNPTSGTWTNTPDMALVSRFFSETISLADGRMMVAGGVGGPGIGGAVEIYDDGLRAWTQVNSMNTERYLGVATELADGRILVIGGITVTNTGLSLSTNAAETYLPCPPNLRPVAICANRTISAGPTCQGGPVSVNNGSYDPDNGPGPLSIYESPGAPFALGNTTVTLVADDSNLSSTCSAVVTVKDNTPPQLTCPANVNLQCTNGGAVLTYQTPQATDNCSGATVTCTPPSGTQLTFGAPPTTVTCTARDSALNQSSCSFQANVVDTTPPVAGTSRGVVLWPADGTLQEISLMDCANFLIDSCTGREIPLKDHGVITKITSDELEDAAGPSDGNTLGDMVIKKPWLALLRAERDTTHNGRVYTIHYRATDSSGNAVTSFCKVTVPVTSGVTAVEGPPLYCVGPNC